MNKKAIIVIGETCEDIFQYGKCNRLCPEAPVPVFLPTQQVSNLGMADNVKNNIVSLLGETSLYEVCLVRQKDSIIKTRLVDEESDQLIVRIDREGVCEPIETNVLEGLKNKYNTDIAAIVISDYNKGFLPKESIIEISEWCNRNRILSFLDTKKQLGEWSRLIDFVKINQKELAAHDHFPNNSCKNLLVTLGARGCDWYNLESQKEKQTIPSENSVEIREVSGAGDTFLAAFVVKFLRSYDVVASMRYANVAASLAVQKRGVVSIAKEELEKYADKL